MKGAIREKGTLYTLLFPRTCRVFWKGCGQDVLYRSKFWANKVWLYAHKVTLLDSEQVKLEREEIPQNESNLQWALQHLLVGRLCHSSGMLWQSLSAETLWFFSDWSLHLSSSLLMNTTVWSGLSTKELRSPLASSGSAEVKTNIAWSQAQVAQHYITCHIKEFA